MSDYRRDIDYTLPPFVNTPSCTNTFKPGILAHGDRIYSTCKTVNAAHAPQNRTRKKMQHTAHTAHVVNAPHTTKKKLMQRGIQHTRQAHHGKTAHTAHAAEHAGHTTHTAHVYLRSTDRAYLGWDGTERDLAEAQSADPRGAVAVEDRLDRRVKQVLCGARRRHPHLDDRQRQ